MAEILNAGKDNGSNPLMMDQKQFEAVEEMVMLKDKRVREHGAESAVLKKKGEKVKVSGKDKVLLLASKSAQKK